ncbi:uncharacterized protein KZ484_019073 [Pholidichthys leucotaenia]
MHACLSVYLCLCVSECTSHPAAHLEEAAFILEQKNQAESSSGDGGRREALSPSPAVLTLTHTESPGPWQSESLLVESWSTMGDIDPEDTNSLDSGDGMILTTEENHSSNSDMVHLEREEAEMLEEADRERARRREEEEDDEMQRSVLSILGEEKGLGELREEEQDLQAPETEELLVSSEEPQVEEEAVEFRQVVPPMALPPLPIVRLDPPSTTSTPVASATTSEVEDLYSTQGLHPPSILAPVAPQLPAVSLQFSQLPLSDVDKHSGKKSKMASEEQERQPTAPKTKPLSTTELLYGGAALVAVIGVLAYGAVVYCRK